MSTSISVSTSGSFSSVGSSLTEGFSQANNKNGIAKNNNFKNINVDIMYGLPNDNIRLLKNDFKYLRKYNIPHVSCYSLILEQRTILYNKYLKGEFKLFNEDK